METPITVADEGIGGGPEAHGLGTWNRLEAELRSRGSMWALAGVRTSRSAVCT